MRDICLEQLNKCYGDRMIFRNLSCTFQGGGRYAIMAPSGYGKTTLFRILSGLEKADDGRIEGMPERLGMSFQDDRLLEQKSSIDNIVLACGLSHAEAEEELRKLLPEPELHKPVRKLSGGEKRRVSIVRAMNVRHAALFILDEPFSGLDEASRQKTADYIVNHLNGGTLLFSTHEKEEAALLSADIINLQTV